MRNIRGTHAKHAEHTQNIYAEHMQNTRKTCGTHTEHTQNTCNTQNTRGTCKTRRTHAENTRRTHSEQTQNTLCYIIQKKHGSVLTLFPGLGTGADGLWDVPLTWLVGDAKRFLQNISNRTRLVVWTTFR